MRLNMAMIAQYIHPEAKTAIDVGSNEGLLTCALAEMGLAVKGYEQNASFVEAAEKLKLHFGTTASFERRLLTLEDVKAASPVDIVLFLSVHHQIAAANSLGRANDMLTQLIQKARLKVFFQPAMVQEKYGKHTIPFADNDYAAAENYFRKLAAGAGMPHFANLGFSINDLPKSEPLRPMYLFSRQPIFVRTEARIARLLESAAEAAVRQQSRPSLASRVVRGLLPPIVPSMARRLQKKLNRK